MELKELRGLTGLRVGDKLYCKLSCYGGHFKVGNFYKITCSSEYAISMDGYNFSISSVNLYFYTMQELRKIKLAKICNLNN